MSFLGVPPLLNSLSQKATTVELLYTDALTLFSPLVQVWGVFYQGTLIAQADSVLTFDYKRDWNLPTYPQENGGFQTYNKVQMPFDARVTLVKGGSLVDRQTFLKNLEDAAETLNLYDINTPEKTYSNCNIDHISVRRSSQQGMTLLAVDLWLLEIRNTAVAAFSTNVQNPGSCTPSNGGSVQALSQLYPTTLLPNPPNASSSFLNSVDLIQ